MHIPKYSQQFAAGTGKKQAKIHRFYENHRIKSLKARATKLQ
jgi:hypothetical protein